MEYHVEVNQDESPLSKKENEVYRLAAEGRLRPAIADLLHRSPGTINTHFNHILQKLNAENIQQAIAVGFIKGILSCRDKLPMLAIVLGTSFSASYGLLPSKAYAHFLPPETLNEDGERTIPVDDKYPMVRVRVRGGGRTPTGSQTTRLSGRIRRRGDG